jgi:hypothetical protein
LLSYRGYENHGRKSASIRKQKQDLLIEAEKPSKKEKPHQKQNCHEAEEKSA